MEEWKDGRAGRAEGLGRQKSVKRGLKSLLHPRLRREVCLKAHDWEGECVSQPAGNWCPPLTGTPKKLGEEAFAPAGASPMPNKRTVFASITRAPRATPLQRVAKPQQNWPRRCWKTVSGPQALQVIPSTLPTFHPSILPSFRPSTLPSFYSSILPPFHPSRSLVALTI